MNNKKTYRKVVIVVVLIVSAGLVMFYNSTIIDDYTLNFEPGEDSLIFELIPYSALEYYARWDTYRCRFWLRFELEQEDYDEFLNHLVQINLKDIYPVMISKPQKKLFEFSKVDWWPEDFYESDFYLSPDFKHNFYVIEDYQEITAKMLYLIDEENRRIYGWGTCQ